MADTAPDEISLEAFNAAPSAPSPSTATMAPQDQQQPQPQAAHGPDEISLDSFNSAPDDEEKYGTPGQMAITALEGVGRGIAGPLAPILEKKLGVDEQDIRNREATNPFTHGLGEAAGLVGSTVAIPGLGMGMEAAGRGAAELAASTGAKVFLHPVGSAAVKAAAEMAVLQGSNEAAKMVLHDPEASAQSALSNIGMAAALGGAGGALVSGVVSPLWKATVGSKLDGLLGGFKDHLNGSAKSIPEDILKAEQTLGINIAPEIKGANTSDSAARYYNDLKSSQSQPIYDAEKNLNKDISDSILKSVGKPIEEFQNYDVATAGREGMENFTKEYRAKSEPITKEFNDLTKPFEEARVTDDRIGELGNNVVQKANEKGWIGSDIPQQKLVDGVLDRLPKLKTAMDLKRLMTTIDNIASDNYQALGYPARELKNIVLDAQQNILGDAIGAKSPELFNKYQAARGAYKDLARMSDEAGANLGIGKFSGPEGFMAKLQEKRTPEEFFRRLSPEGNAEILPFLQKHFPETLENIKDNELKKLIAPAIRAAKEGTSINVKTLNNAIEKKMAGQQGYLKAIVPEELINKAAAGDKLLSTAIPGIKDSGTGGWIERKMKGIPTGAITAVGWLTGHNPIAAAAVGSVAEILGKKIPEAYKLALLKFVASDQPIKAEGFKAAVDYLHNVIKGETMLNKAADLLFTSGAQVLASELMPSKADNDKLDDLIGKYDKNPNKIQELAQGNGTGHYFPDHQMAMSQATASAVTYLQSIKPRPYQASPLDKPIDPTPQEMARYNRALTVANQPLSVLQRAKEGTLQMSDLQDLHSMYPALYTKIIDKINDGIINKKQEEQQIPYKTRMGIALILGQPLDISMRPQSIQMTQMTYAPKQPPQQPQVNAAPKKGTSTLGNKTTKGYMTPGQAAESDRSNRD